VTKDLEIVTFVMLDVIVFEVAFVNRSVLRGSCYKCFSCLFIRAVDSNSSVIGRNLDEEINVDQGWIDIDRQITRKYW
jgi:hypothetical protein